MMALNQKNQPDRSVMKDHFLVRKTNESEMLLSNSVETQSAVQRPKGPLIWQPEAVIHHIETALHSSTLLQVASSGSPVNHVSCCFMSIDPFVILHVQWCNSNGTYCKIHGFNEVYVVLFYIFLIACKSHENTQTNNLFVHLIILILLSVALRPKPIGS